MAKLEKKEYWKRKQEKQVEKYSFNKKDGLVFVFEVEMEGFPKYDNIYPNTTE